MGSYIKLVAMAMELENDVDCLEVRDGDSDEAPLLGKFCGRMLPSTISPHHANTDQTQPALRQREGRCQATDTTTEILK